MTRYTVLITGVGSLAGKGILDSLEGRREHLRIVGTGFGEPLPGMLRCDAWEHTAPSDDPEFPEHVQEIASRVHTDVVIPARDDDVPIVAGLSVASMTGSNADVATDKWLTYQFATARGLPVVPTALPGSGQFRPPAVSKPRTGGGSVGVRLLLTDRAWEAAQAESGVVLQPLLGTEVTPPDPDVGMPVFWSAPQARQGGVQGVIGPDGEVGIAAAFETKHRFGWVMEQHLVDDPEVLDLGLRYLTALAADGWRGPMNVAMLHDGHRWLCLELNPRFTGGTASRTAMGFDEVGWAINRWAGRTVVPALPGPRGNVVYQQLSTYPMWRERG